MAFHMDNHMILSANHAPETQDAHSIARYYLAVSLGYEPNRLEDSIQYTTSI